MSTSSNKIENKQSESNFVQDQMEIATKALNALADEYAACVEILRSIANDDSDFAVKSAAKMQSRMGVIERYFKSIGSNVTRYAEV